MIGFSSEERLAIFLTLLGDQAVELALPQLKGDRPEQVRRFLQDYRQEPPTEEEVSAVLEDFDRYFRFAVNTLEGQIQQRRKDGQAIGGELGPEGSPEAKEQAKRAAIAAVRKRDVTKEQVEFPVIDSTSDPSQDLNYLHPYQIAKVIGEDQPKTIAMVLAQIDPDQAADVLKFLSPELRTRTFLLMSQPITVPDPIVQKVLRSTFDKSNAIRYSQPIVDRTAQLVAVLRNMSKPVRLEILNKLRDQQPDLANDIRNKMFEFEDLLRLDNRSVQSVLTKLSSDRLVMSLTKAPEEILQKVLTNMSKRARETMEEEISFNSRATEQDIEAARAEIAQLLAQMDEAGEISL
ncbi:MAG: FliG C-terminal domain-containing protein [Planctomycetota bacterium]